MRVPTGEIYKWILIQLPGTHSIAYQIFSCRSRYSLSFLLLEIDNWFSSCELSSLGSTGTVIFIGHCHSVVSVVPENPEIKASAVFRSQLMTPHNANGTHLPLPDDLARLKPDQVQVVAKEPRVGTWSELMRIALSLRILHKVQSSSLD